jgi:TldD protein
VEISKLFRKYPGIQESSVTFYSRVNNQTFVDTEKNRSREAKLLTYVEISAKTQSNDGDPLECLKGFYCHTAEQLPDFAIMKEAVEAMAETLSLQVAMEKAEDYAGPVLFIGQAAAEFVFQLLGKGVSDPRTPLLENEMLSRGASKDMGMLTKRIGRRVMPDFLYAYDDPTRADWNGKPLIGHFLVDDQGVCAERVDLVTEQGKLASVLMSRAPIKKISDSNGHGRFRSERYLGRVSGMVGNLIVQSKEKAGSVDLMADFLDICRDFEIPYGIVVTNIAPARPRTTRDRYMSYFTAMTGGGNETSLLSSVVTAYKVDVETGSVELIRGLDFTSVTPRALRDVIGVGDKEFVYNFIYYDEQGNAYPMSVVTPALLVEEMELESSGKKAKKLPILSHPYFGYSDYTD